MFIICTFIILFTHNIKLLFATYANAFAEKTARANLSLHANIDMSKQYARGAFKLVYKGEYTCGKREGQECVSKVFASGCVYESAFFHTEMEVISAAMDVIQRFNAAKIIDRHVFLNQPEIWEFTEHTKYAGQKTLVEPFIQHFQKFNSNTGWNDDGTAWNQVMQAISHFSYHVSGGRIVLCDLQGGIYNDGAVLTDPVVMSGDRRYGPTDLGRQGIVTFFARHSCNKYCQSSWTKPRYPIAYFEEKEGTSMMREVPTCSSRTPLTYH